MRKIFALIVSLLMVASFSTLSTTPVQADVYNYSWIAPLYRSYDSFYRTSVSAYETGSTAQLRVVVYNDWEGYPNITVTAVKVSFDWDVNYTSTETPRVIRFGEFHDFMINFTVPSINVASNMKPHTYIIYVEFSYDASESYWTYHPWESFAVYSAEQAEAQELYQELDALSYLSPNLMSSEARASWFEAPIEFRTGATDYRNGDFTGAKTHYQTARNLYNQAIDSEATRGTALENALIQASMILSVGIAVGMILIGIGVIVYALAKRKIAPSSVTTASST